MMTKLIWPHINHINVQGEGKGGTCQVLLMLTNKVLSCNAHLQGLQLRLHHQPQSWQRPRHRLLACWPACRNLRRHELADMKHE